MKSTHMLLTALCIATIPVLAQSPSDRMATAQMHIAQLSNGIANKQRQAESIQSSIDQSDRRIADLEIQKAAKPKFAILYDDQIRTAKGERAGAQAQLKKVNEDLAEREQSKIKYEQDFVSAKAAAAREKKNNADGVSLDEALKGKPKKK